MLSQPNTRVGVLPMNEGTKSEHYMTCPFRDCRNENSASSTGVNLGARGTGIQGSEALGNLQCADSTVDRSL